MKLRRVYETAEEEGKSVEEVAIDRFGSLELFEEARSERRLLDEREGKRGESSSSRKHNSDNNTGERRFMFTDVGGSGASSRSSTFRRPDMGGSTPGTPTPAGRPTNPRFDSLRLPSQGETPIRTPVPTVMTPSQSASNVPRAMSPQSLNRLQAKVLRAKLMGATNADKLQEEYDRELHIVSSGRGNSVEVKVLPTLDSRGRMYDVGYGKEDEALPGNRRKKESKVRPLPTRGSSWE